ncbi:MAG: type IV toxin-antitoxin system AbiEi family antitoxin domain-containing protein, partial [Lapillicoccus sp.]
MPETYAWPPTPGAPPEPANLDALAQVAAEQHGLVTRAQCLGAGISRKGVEHRLSRGLWVRAQRGVYLTQPGRADWWTRAYAAHLACGPDAAWSHHTAAYAWGLLRHEPRVIELVVPKDFAVRTPTGTRMRRSR